MPIMQEDEKKRSELIKTETETMKTKKEILDDLLEKKHISIEYYKEQLNLPK